METVFFRVCSKQNTFGFIGSEREYWIFGLLYIGIILQVLQRPPLKFWSRLTYLTHQNNILVEHKKNLDDPCYMIRVILKFLITFMLSGEQVDEKENFFNCLIIAIVATRITSHSIYSLL